MPASTTIGVFLDQVERRGDAPFLSHPTGSGWETLSWSEAGVRVLRLASALAAEGVEPGSTVVLIAENRYEWILADLAIQANGAATVPIYPSLTPESVGQIVANSAPVLAIAGTAEAAAKIPAGPKVVGFDREVASWMAGEPAEDRLAAARERAGGVAADDVATIIYTSGTTGEPKGVVLTHSRFVAVARSSLSLFDIGDDDLLLSFLPFAHVLERESGVFTAITAGAQIYVGRGIEHLAADIPDVNPTVMLGVPRLFEKIVGRIEDQVRKQPPWKRWLFGLASAGRLGPLDHLILKPVRLRIAGSRLKFFVSGGAPLAREVETFFWSLGIPIFNGWGMTETTSAAVANSFQAHRYGTVGKPLPGVEVRFAEDGELEVRGPGIMRGYHRDPEATAAVLNDGWLKTGDIGEQDEDGFISITDRKKDLMKTSGGKYVAPQPMESSLQGTRYIETVVLVGDDRPYLTALIVPKWDHLRTDLNLAEPPEKLVNDDRARALVRKAIDELNSSLARYETIKYFRLLPRDLDEASGERTPSLKVKRAAVREKYRDLIDEMYESGARARQSEKAPA